MRTLKPGNQHNCALMAGSANASSASFANWHIFPRRFRVLSECLPRFWKRIPCFSEGDVCTFSRTTRRYLGELAIPLGDDGLGMPFMLCRYCRAINAMRELLVWAGNVQKIVVDCRLVQLNVLQTADPQNEQHFPFYFPMNMPAEVEACPHPRAQATSTFTNRRAIWILHPARNSLNRI